MDQHFTRLCINRSDINEHLPTLSAYASKCERILELGVRGVVSSWAFVHGLVRNGSSTKKIHMNDLFPCDVDDIIRESRTVGVDITCEWKNDLELDMDGPVDLVFIDTWHVYGQLKRELEKFCAIATKYIIMHDTTVDAIHGETIRLNLDARTQSIVSGFPIEEITKGLWPAVEEFLEGHPEWKLEKRFMNNNGLTILSRV
jgi:hypothetical protein